VTPVAPAPEVATSTRARPARGDRSAGARLEVAARRLRVVRRAEGAYARRVADLGPAFGALLELFGPLAAKALGAFARTALGMCALSLLACAGAYALAADGSPLRGAIALAASLAIFAFAGALLSVKRALGSALLHGFERLSLGSKTSRLLFERIAGVDLEAAHGERGPSAVRYAERVPLAQAEARLVAAADWLLHTGGGATGFLRRRLRKAAVDRVAALTLARFRSDAAQHGGVDVARVRDEVTAQVDALVAKTISGALFKVTLVIVVAACAASAGASLLVRRVIS